MAFVKGVSGNPKGKPKGALNKQTRDIKDVIDHLISALHDGKLDSMLETLLVDRPEAVLSFLGKIAPKNLDIKANISTEDNPVLEQLKEIKKGIVKEKAEWGK